MIISRDLKVHQCIACKAKLDDVDFTWCGVSVFPKNQLFFEYMCPRCSHRGRYFLDVEGDLNAAEASQLLIDLVKDKTCAAKIDWDAIDWEV